MPTRASEMFQIKIYGDKHNSLGMMIHSFQSFERIQKWGVDTDAQSSESPYHIRVVSKPRTIKLYAVAAMKFDIAI